MQRYMDGKNGDGHMCTKGNKKSCKIEAELLYLG